MKMDEGLDTGPMLLKKSLSITPGMTAADLHDVLAKTGGLLLLEAMEAYSIGALHPIPQPSHGITYAAKLTKDEGRINWRESADMWMRKIQAFTPWPGVWFDHDGTRLKVLAAKSIPHVKGNPGTVMDSQLTVACGDGALQIQVLQRPGGSPVDAAHFLRGYALPAGTVLPCPVIN